jgi:cytochrome c-type biogenesis protein CcsB
VSAARADGAVALLVKPARRATAGIVGGAAGSGAGGDDDGDDDADDADDASPLELPTSRVAGGDLRAETAGRIAVSLTALAFVLHLTAVVCRGFATHRAPWGDLYEFTVAGTLVGVAALLVLMYRDKARWLGLFAVTLVLCLLGVSVTLLHPAAEQLVPALHSYWLAIHVTAAVVSSGGFMVGSLATVLFLFRDGFARRASRPLVPGERRRFQRFEQTLQRLPEAESLDRTAYRVFAFTFPIWTFTIIAGAIWAEDAWGRYWGWDPTETFAFITWVVFAAYLHARATFGWKGRAAAVVGLIGFGCFLFNYFGVSIFINGLHSYAGV